MVWISMWGWEPRAVPDVQTLQHAPQDIFNLMVDEKFLFHLHLRSRLQNFTDCVFISGKGSQNIVRITIRYRNDKSNAPLLFVFHKIAKGDIGDFELARNVGDVAIFFFPLAVLELVP